MGAESLDPGAGRSDGPSDEMREEKQPLQREDSAPTGAGVRSDDFGNEIAEIAEIEM